MTATSTARTPLKNRPLHERTTLRTGDVAAVCEVATHTAAAWIDSGELPGYRLPNSTDRRVKRVDLIAFLRARGMPAFGLLPPGYRVLLVGLSDRDAGRVRTALPPGDEITTMATGNLFAAGKLAAETGLHAVVIDFAVGRSAALEVAAAMPDATRIAVAAEDDPHAAELADRGFAAVFQHPLDAERLAELLARQAADAAE